MASIKNCGIWRFAYSVGSLFILYCASEALAANPSFDYRKVQNGSIEKMVGEDNELAKLDRRLAEVYAVAAKKAVNEKPTILIAEQRGWIKGRNESLWEHQGEALITWGYGSKERKCKKR